MPSFTYTQSIAAGDTYLPLEKWMYKYVPYACVVEIIDNAGAVGIVKTVTFGSDTIQAESPVQAGGTTGVMPARLAAEPITEKAAPSDLLAITYRNTTGAPVVVNGTIQLTRL